MVKNLKIATLAGGIAALLATGAYAQDVLINEFDTDTSAAEYIELYNPTGSAINLTTGQYCLVFLNGNGDAIYQSTDLTGSIPAGGYLLVAETGVTTISGQTVDVNGAWGSFQNGQTTAAATEGDAIALVKGAAASAFGSSGDYSTKLTAASGASQVDAVIYTSAAAAPDPGLEAELGLSAGKTARNSSSGSTQRVTNGQGGANNNWATTDWTISSRTPKASNGAIPPTNVSNIAAALALSNGTEVIIAGPVTVTTATNSLNANQGGGARNQFTVQDTSGADGQSAILIDDFANTAGVAVTPGQTLTNLRGTLGVNSGLRQLVPSAALTVGGSVALPSPLVLTVAVTDRTTIQSELIRINGADIAETGTFTADTTYTLTAPAGLVVTQIRVEDASTAATSTIPASTFDITGICGEFGGVGQILPRTAGDISAASVSDWTMF